MTLPNLTELTIAVGRAKRAEDAARTELAAARAQVAAANVAFDVAHKDLCDAMQAKAAAETQIEGAA